MEYTLFQNELEQIEEKKLGDDRLVEILNDVVECLKNETLNLDDECLSNILKILCIVDDRLIIKAKCNMSYRRYLFMLKYNENNNQFLNKVTRNKNKLYYNGQLIHNLVNKDSMVVDVLELDKSEIILECRTNLSYFADDYIMYALEENTQHKTYVELMDNPAFNQLSCLDDLVFISKRFVLKLPVNNKCKYSFHICHGSDFDEVLSPRFRSNASLCEKTEHSYFVKNKWICKLINKRICLYDYKPLTLLNTERRFRKEIARSKPNDKTLIFKLRNSYFFRKLFKKKEIWIISDRAHIAGDNGEAFFKYVSKRKEIKAYFLLDRNSEDYNRLSNMGRVISYGSYKHRLYYLLCDKLISASADAWVTNINEELDYYLKGLYDYKYVFLQHGIIQKDFSKWLNKCNKDIKVFVTAAKDEYDSIVNGAYNYTSKQVKLTGLARYDSLVDERERVIAIMPTWRKHIAAEHVEINGNAHIKVRGYSPNFKETDYFKFYQGLLDDKRFIQLLEENDYQCKFYLHPSFSAQLVDFESHNERVIIPSKKQVYNEVFKKSSILITDYSSVAMDFAYLKKPVIYSQFDILDFLNNHTGKQGYFDYETVGFGPVCHNLQTTIEAIESIIKKDCNMEQKYIQRVEDFFAYTDFNNCQRIFDEIIKC